MDHPNTDSRLMFLNLAGQRSSIVINGTMADDVSVGVDILGETNTKGVPKQVYVL